MSLPLFETPMIDWSRAKPPNGIRVRGWHNYAVGTGEEGLLQRIGAKRAYMRHRQYDHDFAKLIAKIAWCAWVDEFGLESLAEGWLPPVILGKLESVGTHVGTFQYALRGDPAASCLHSVHLAVKPHEGSHFPIVRVQLFVQLTPSPSYISVVGRLRDDFSASPALLDWTEPRCGRIGRPLGAVIPRWVGTQLLTDGKRRTHDIDRELAALGLSLTTRMD